MPSDIRVKICGLTDPADIPAAIVAGASYLGFNFFPKSPRYLDLEAAAFMATSVPVGVGKVGLTVDADDATLDLLTTSVPLDFLQLHGKESPARVSEVKARYGLPVIKVVGISGPEDVTQIDFYGKVADQILVDAKPPKGADRPGGNAVAFDWKLIAGRRWPVPWMLAGGLNPDNVAEAIRLTGARQVDVASGVESAPGVKDADLMRAFIENARA
ncbi:phosphoribosylanthranilate isomerase [Roseovarius indicus]|uniref:N-(5'-phosphoribosyl)anthranilate isomerase n=1 Tax=Roseovarius indicus TaxID=540747 RepID=A0A0T5P6C2_9RHOB|nr:phosphoribosylanthranilate isomerase [Roseovarius indicus]KRS16672.1 N-(5'-phosphoribosyl)anthranilate isomerase [Roseovarius indicus]QEW28289.1 N-(5'-phosphoribosyl)anthranilate isomerase [Roseovarius indicus]SFE13478.1 phosphoribosylanthranilate isomerase [Roseovarius indicus]